MLFKIYLVKPVNNGNKKNGWNLLEILRITWVTTWFSQDSLEEQNLKEWVS